MSETYNYIGARCRISGNPCGTDTHPPEAPCQCDTCRAIACIAELEAELKHCRKTAFADAYAKANIENAGRIKALEAVLSDIAKNGCTFIGDDCPDVKNLAKSEWCMPCKAKRALLPGGDE